MRDEFYRFLKEEQETIITFDYEGRILNLYTNQINAMKRLYNIFKDECKFDYIDGKIASINLYIPFSDRESYKKALSINTILYKAK